MQCICSQGSVNLSASFVLILRANRWLMFLYLFHRINLWICLLCLMWRFCCYIFSVQMISTFLLLLIKSPVNSSGILSVLFTVYTNSDMIGVWYRGEPNHFSISVNVWCTTIHVICECCLGKAGVWEEWLLYDSWY